MTESSVFRRLSAIAGLVVAASSCAAPARLEGRPAEVAPRLAAAPERAPAPKRRPLTFSEASARGEELRALWQKAPRYRDAELAEWVLTTAPPEAEVRAVVDALLRRPAEAAPLIDSASEILGEIGSATPGATETTKTLLRASALGHWRAGSALERILERRLAAATVSCAPPTSDELDRARAGLTDFLVIDRSPGKADRAVLVARPPTASELEDLAYLYAALADTGAEVGLEPEDTTTPGTPSTDRALLRAKAASARASGDIDGHLDAGLAYLATLGYPGPIRANDERDERWGGAGYSFLMRELALSAELLGKYDVAESLYRRAAWGGGACGTSAPSYRDDQISGVVRAVELGRGCRGAVAERLFAVSLDLRGVHGPEQLAARGFDVARLYRAALLTRNRSDEAALLGALANAKGDGVARLQRLGKEDWVARIRAIPGFADTAKKSATGTLIALLGVGDASVRRDVIEALGSLAQDRGSDPCEPSNGGFGFFSSGSSRGEREVATVMTRCETRIAAPDIKVFIDVVAKLATDPDPTTRQAVAHALGNMGSPEARPVLRRLARDTFDAGGQVCTSTNGGPTVCKQNKIVSIAAEEALAKIAETERARAELRTRARR